MNAVEEQVEVTRIIKATNGNPEERQRQLAILAEKHSLCPGVVCKCLDTESKFCPRHGRK